MASSSKTRSRASAALLGESRDSWEWDSLKLCIKRVLEREEEEEKIYLLSNLRYDYIYRSLVKQSGKIFICYKMIHCSSESCNLNMIFRDLILL